MREAVANTLAHLQRKTIVVSLAKGVEGNTKKTMDELFDEILPSYQSFAILGGAMLAEELMQGMAGRGVVGSSSSCGHIKRLFDDTNLKIECSKDVRGVALCGVLKNIYAIALGIADGMRWSGNQKGWLAAKAIREIVYVVELLGGKKETAISTAGLGDLVSTGYSPYSRNRQIGEELIKTGESCLKGEGLIALPSMLVRELFFRNRS